MRPTACTACAATAIAFAVSAAAAVEEKSTKPRLAVLELKNSADAQLAIDSVHWGEWIADVERPQAVGRGIDIARVDGEIVAPSSTAGKQPKTRPMGLVPGSSKPRPAASGEKGGTEDINIGVGELQESRGGVSVAAGDITGDGRSAASGQATGKRQHMPIRSRTYYDAPLQRGSVTLRLAQPWAGCAVGDRFNGIYLTTGSTHRYRLDGAEIASCGSTSVTINYAQSASAGAPVR